MGALKLEDIPSYTYEDYKQWEGRWELIYGVPYAMAPMPTLKHQRVSMKIGRFLDEALKDCKRCKSLLPVDWKVSKDTVVQPDNLVICDEPFLEKSYIKKAPKIIFEVLSNSTRKKDMITKFEIYEEEGVKYYIIVDPDENFVKIYSLKDGRYIKVFETENEKFSFELDECDSKIDFDFSLIWD